MNDRLLLIASLLLLVFCYGLIFSLIGGGVLSKGLQQRLGLLCPAIGLLISYLPIVVLSAIFSRTTAFIIVVITTVTIWVFAFRNEKLNGAKTNINERLLFAINHAVFISLLSILYWVPGVVGNHYGMFTERGGDLTIYAGTPAKVGNQPLWSMNDLSALSSSYFGRSDNPWVIAEKTLSASDDPPAPGWSIKRLVTLRWATHYTGWFGLQQVLFTIPVHTFEIRYWALTAYLWTLMISAIAQVIYIRAGLRNAIFSLLILAASHGLVGIGYNHYYPQLLGNCLISSLICFIVLPDKLRFSSLILVLLSISTTLNILIAYYPSTPMMIVPISLVVFNGGKLLPLTLFREFGKLRTNRKVLLTSFIGFYIVSMIIAIVEPIKSTLSYAVDANNYVDIMTYWGLPRPYNVTWLAALFGAYNLQQLQPYVRLSPSLLGSYLFATTGLLLLASIVFRIFSGLGKQSIMSKDSDNSNQKSNWALIRNLALSVVLGGSVIIFLGSKTEYTQFKALGYFLPYILLLLTFPLPDNRNKFLNGSSFSLKIIFLLSLFFFRVHYAMNIAIEKDSAILQTSLPKIAALIKNLDPDAFVLAYPPSNNHLSLWELGLRDIQGLVGMKYYQYPKPREQYFLANGNQHIWIVKQGAPDQIPPDTLTKDDLWAYRPLSSDECEIEATPLVADTMAEVDFKLLGNNAEQLWLEQNMQYYVFNPSKARNLVLVLRGYGNNPPPQTIDVLYPTPGTVPLVIKKQQDMDLIANIPNNTIKDKKTGTVNPFIIIQVKGLYYSLLTCGN